MKVLLTGGCGFIGSAVVRHLIRDTDHVVVNVDKLTYAASEDALETARGHNRHVLIRADITNAAAMRQIFATHQPDVVMHAGGGKPCRSLDRRPRPRSSRPTSTVNLTLLEASRQYSTLGSAPMRRTMFRFHHISTDEVFGALGRR